MLTVHVYLVLLYNLISIKDKAKMKMDTVQLLFILFSPSEFVKDLHRDLLIYKQSEVLEVTEIIKQK